MARYLDVGDVVTASRDCLPYYQKGDRATLVCQDEGGDWWADFICNEYVYGDGIWCMADDQIEEN